MQKNLFNTDIDRLLEHVTGRLDDGWRAQVTQLLQLPDHIRHWRSIIWEVMGESIYQRVQSFPSSPQPCILSRPHVLMRLHRWPHAGQIVSGPDRVLSAPPVDDEMRSFLSDAIDYLSSFTDGNIEVPVSIIRAMNDVERIAQIEESALPPEKQDVIRTCLLQIARMAGENG